MHIIASGYIYDSHTAPTHQRSCAFTTACLMRDGTILVSGRWGSARDSLDGHACIFASTDFGATWEKRYDGYRGGDWDGTPGEIKGLTSAELAPGQLTATTLWVDRSNPSLPFINPETQGLLPMWILHSTSTDGGRNWSEFRQMDTTPHVAASPCSSPIIRLQGGVLAQPYERWKTYNDPTPGHPAAHLRFSYDGGDSWPDAVTVAQHPDNRLAYWDQRLAVHPTTGQWVAMFWTHDFTAGVDLDVHIGWGSVDGKTWSLPRGTGLPGQHCQPLSLGDNRLVAVYTQRHTPPGIAMSLSNDFGQTWERSQDLMVYDSTAGTESGTSAARSQAELWRDMELWRFGHPRAVLLPNGEVFVVFYAGDSVIKSARWARVAV
jgi:sialidase-1